MKYAILLKDRRMVDAPQIEEYCTASCYASGQIVIFEKFSIFCRRLKVGDSIIAASIVALSKRFGDIIYNFKLLAERMTNPHCIDRQEYLDLQKEKIKALLKRGKSVLQISGLPDCSYRTLYYYLKKHPEIQNG